MTTPAPNQRVNSINAIRHSLPVICPDAYTGLLYDNQSAKLDPCLIDTVKKLYDQVNCTIDFSRAFRTFRVNDCSDYLQKKIAELHTNAAKIAKTVRDISAEDQTAYIFIAERLQDLVFVVTFVTRQHLAKDKHTCLGSLRQLEQELQSLRQRTLMEDGNHSLSLAKFEKIERELKELETAIENNQFDQIAQAAQELDRDLVSSA